MSEQSLTVALTGGTGFVGGHVLKHLLAAGHHVRVLARDISKLPGDARITDVPGDLFDEAALAKLVEGADAVVHLVGIIMEQPKADQTFERVHVEGTLKLLHAAQESGSVRKWVHMSALGARPKAPSEYHRTKYEAESSVRDSLFDHTIFRPSIIHGPDGEFMQMVKTWWTKWLNPPFIVPYFGAGPFGLGGAGKLQPVYVEDVAKCFVAALSNERASHETYPLGGPDRLTWPQLLKTVKKYLPGAKDKWVVAVPVWKAKILASFPGAPFNVDQVVMSQEDSTCSTAKVTGDFEIELAGFEEMVSQYAPNM